MNDQLKRLKEMGLQVGVISGQQQFEDDKVILDSPGKQQIVLLSPEMAITDEDVRQYILTVANRIVCMVVDEAHCVASW